jgi:hypothetical protein
LESNAIPSGEKYYFEQLKRSYKKILLQKMPQMVNTILLKNSNTVAALQFG